MRSLFLSVGVLGFLGCLPADAAEKPEWQRTLPPDESRQATDLRKRINDHIAGERFTDALPLATELSELRERLQGKDHWQTRDARRLVQYLKDQAALSAEQRQELRQSLQWFAQSEKLHQQRKFADAGQLLQKRLAVVEKILGAEHADAAQAYQALSVNRGAQGRHADAEPFSRKALAIWEKVLGTGHPGTAQGYSNLATVLSEQGKYGEASTFDRKALVIWENTLGPQDPNTARGNANLAATLTRQGKYAEGEVYFRKALAVYAKVAPQHALTASCYHNLATNLEHQGRHAEAEPLVRKALAIREQTLGARHPDTARSYLAVAANLNHQSNYAEAEVLCRKAIAIWEASVGPLHPSTAEGYYGLADVLFGEARFAEAEPMLWKVLGIRQRALGPEHPETANAFASLSGNLTRQGKYAEAEGLALKALAIREKSLGAQHPDTAWAYNNLAMTYQFRDRFVEAEPLLRKAHAILEQALGAEDPQTDSVDANLASNLHNQRKFEEADGLLRRVVAAREKKLGPEHAATLVVKFNLAASLQERGRFADAEPLLREVVRAGEKSRRHPELGRFLVHLGLGLCVEGKYAEAEPLLRKAVDMLEVTRLRRSGTGFERALAESERPNVLLSLCLVRQGKHVEAVQAAEAGFGRGLLDDLTGADTREEGQVRKKVARLDQLDARLAPLLARQELSDEQRRERESLTTERATLQGEIDRQVAAGARQRVLSVEQIQASLPADGALVFWIDVQSSDRHLGHLGCVVRRKGSPVWVKLPGSGPEKAWTKADRDLPRRFREALTTRAADWRELADKLRVQRIDPLVPHLAARDELPEVQRLIVVPLGPMAGVPIDALTGRYAISYTPSGTIYARLAKSHRALREPTLLAVGDPTFASPRAVGADTFPDHGLLIVHVQPGSVAQRAGLRSDDVLLEYNGTKLATAADVRLREQGGAVPVRVWRGGKTLMLEVAPGKIGVMLDREPAPQALKRHQELDKLVASSRGAEPKPLPGTRREVEAVGRLFDGRAKLLLGSDASQQQLDELATAGKLREYRVLHFATHGRLDVLRPSQSALLLATDKLGDPGTAEGKKVFTGSLTVAEILTWKLDADMVVLSACETGLGRTGGGDGYLGFVQALMQAGARSVVVSRWPVDDAATALLMARFYENMLTPRTGSKKPLTRAEALREATQWLRNLPRKEARQLTDALARGTLRVGVSPLGKPTEPSPDKSDYPYSHPYFWSAFVLLGDAE